MFVGEKFAVFEGVGPSPLLCPALYTRAAAAAPPADKHKLTPKAKTTSKKGGRGPVRDQPEADPKAQLSFAAEDDAQVRLLEGCREALGMLEA